MLSFSLAKVYLVDDAENNELKVMVSLQSFYLVRFIRFVLFIGGKEANHAVKQ